jgi:ADP-heptose:LPS heptosyltransferase
MAESPRADRILVIRLGALGDVVRTLPAVALLRAQYPSAEITWLVEPGASGVLQGQSLVNEVMVFPRDRLERLLRGFRLAALVRECLRMARLLRAREFDLVLDFHGILKSGVLAWLSAAPLRVAYAPPVGREQGWRFSNQRAVLAPGKMSRFDRNEGLVHYLNGTPSAVSGASLELAPGAALRAAERCLSPSAIIHPGTSPATPYKRYTVEGYAEVARSLRDRIGLPSLVAHGPGQAELEFAKRIVGASQGAASLAPATASFAELAELLAGASLFIGSDSGPLHAASLVGTPVVQILGPTDPVENAPYSATPSRSVRVPVGCSPCRRGCAEATCMRIIPSERITAAAQELLEHAVDDPATAQTNPPTRTGANSSRAQGRAGWKGQ